jgi:hypothetical protein
MDNEITQKIATFIKEADECIEAQQKEIESLKAERGAQKTASESEQAPESTIDKEAVDAAVSNMVDAGFLKEAEAEQAHTAITADPSVLVGFITKLAANTIEHNRNSVPSLGKPSEIQKAASSDAESDVVWESLVQNLTNKQ